MGEFDLESTLCGRRALTEDLEDQAGAVDNLGFGCPFKIALLDRSQRCVDNDKFGVVHPGGAGNLIDLTRPEKSRRLGIAQAEGHLLDNIDTNGSGKAGRFV